MKKEIDELDIEILKYLEDNARKSLKKLADELDKKTSTIYHRLQRLKANNIILGYSTIFNPEFLKIEKIAYHKVTLKSLNISNLDDMFLKSFANFIKDEFYQVIFVALSENTKTIFVISVHITEDDHTDFVNKLKDNAYIDSIEIEFITEIIKGQRLFTFNEKWIDTKSKKSKTQKSDQNSSFEEEDLELEEEDQTMEIKF